MTKENRETMNRALGILEGAYFVAPAKVQDALQAAIDMFDSVLNDEENK